MKRESTGGANPLAQAAAAVPPALLAAATIAARATGLALALFYAVDQSYDGTQVYTVAVAVLLASSLVPLQGRAGQWLSASGASLLLFAGANLTSQPAGIAMLVAGAAGWVATAAALSRRGASLTALGGLVVGAALAFALAVATIALVES